MLVAFSLRGVGLDDHGHDHGLAAQAAGHPGAHGAADDLLQLVGGVYLLGGPVQGVLEGCGDFGGDVVGRGCRAR